jgi:SAM-dependent methyltransferase
MSGSETSDNQVCPPIYPGPDWFATWFNSGYYHLLYQNHNEGEAQTFIDNLVLALKVNKNLPVLDLACGKGRHSRSFNRLGFTVTGLDLSPESIHAATEMASEQGATNLTFRVHDMREPFAHNAYGLVVNLFTSFGYFGHRDENMATLSAIAEALVPDGLVVIDYLNPAPILANLPIRQTISREGVDFDICKWNDHDFIYKNIKFRDKGQDFKFDEQVQILTEDWFRSALQQVGIRLLHLWGTYELNELMPASSPRMIVVGQKVA